MKQDMYAYGEWWVPIYATQVEVNELQQQATWSGADKVYHGPDRSYIPVSTPLGIVKAFAGDWIIKVKAEVYVLTDEEFHNSFIKWDARAGGNTDLQEWPEAPRQLMTRRPVKESHGHVIRPPRSS